MFPHELPHRLIKMFSFAGETVLDPFAGSGTTIKAAMNLNRCGIAYEINSDFLPAIRKRLGIDEPVLFEEQKVEFTTSTNAPPGKVVASPISENENSLQRVADSNENRFGSIVEAKDEKKLKGVRVRQILASNRLRLSDGNEVQLLGIEPLEAREDEALKYLEKMVLGNPVFLKFYSQETTGAYVYLANKTFINAKLIKQGLCKVNLEVEHRHLKRFCAYQQERNHV